MARGAADLALGLEVMAGADAIDGAGWGLELPTPRRKALNEYRVAIMLNDPNGEVEREVQDVLQGLADFLAKSGAQVNDRARPAIDTSEAARLYVSMLRAATSGRQSDEVFEKNLDIVRGLAPGDASYFAEMARANTMRHKDWLSHNQARHRMRLAWAAFFKDYDLLLCPAASSAAFPHDQAVSPHQRPLQC